MASLGEDDAPAAPVKGVIARNAAEYSLEQPEVVVVGAGTAGATMAITLARQGRKVVLIERNLEEVDRIVGELLQPGGLRSLENLGLDECAKDGCDSVVVNGYTIILPPNERYPEGMETLLYYPERDPSNAAEFFGKGVVPRAQGKSQEVPRGRSFHNSKFVQRLRQAAQQEPNVQVIEGTVTKLVEENGVVVGVDYKVTEEGAEKKVLKTLRAPLTVVADGIWSGLRKCSNSNKPHGISTFVGVVVDHPHMEAPVPSPYCGHVILAQPSPILIYQISPTETRVLVDVMGKVPSAATGDLCRFLKHQAQYMPDVFRDSYLRAVRDDNIKSMPNRALPSASKVSLTKLHPNVGATPLECFSLSLFRYACSFRFMLHPLLLIFSLPSHLLASVLAFPLLQHKPGTILIGDALNMRHPLTGGGMTVAIKDVELACGLLEELNFQDHVAMAAMVKRFHSERMHATTINVLANALYDVFSTPEGESQAIRGYLMCACFEYLNMGGLCAAGPVGLLSGLTPKPWVLTTHFFMVAFYAMRQHLLPFGFLNPLALLRVYRILHVACMIIMPLLVLEGSNSTPLAWWPIRKLINLAFPYERMLDQWKE
ncbi:unnamed protein product [Chrysoparadoxa australica]